MILLIFHSSGGGQVSAGEVVWIIHADILPAVPHPAGDRHGDAAVPSDSSVRSCDGDSLLPHRVGLPTGPGSLRGKMMLMLFFSKSETLK